MGAPGLRNACGKAKQKKEKKVSDHTVSVRQQQLQLVANWRHETWLHERSQPETRVWNQEAESMIQE